MDCKLSWCSGGLLNQGWSDRYRHSPQEKMVLWCNWKAQKFSKLLVGVRIPVGLQKYWNIAQLVRAST
jgi:hypothetical protein